MGYYYYYNYYYEKARFYHCYYHLQKSASVFPELSTQPTEHTHIYIHIHTIDQD